MENHKWIAEQHFRCVSPDGRAFDLLFRIGEPETVAPSMQGEHAYSRCWLSLAPLASDRWSPGGNQFQALCLGLDYLRTVFKVFLAEGGRVYWEDTDMPIDIDNSWFGPMPSIPGLALKGRDSVV